MMDKAALRAKFRNVRRELDEEQRRLADREIVDRFFATSAFDNATSLLLYMPTDGEVNITIIAREALMERKGVAFPRVDKDGSMQFHYVRSLLELTESTYGIPAPNATATVAKPDARTIMLVPALAYDRDGYRLGMGGGYYDRYLQDFPGVTIGIIREGALVNELPREAHDVPVDYIITEKQMFKVN